MTRVPGVLAVVCGGLAAAALAGGCGRSESEAAPRPSPAVPAQSAAELSTMLAKVDDVAITLGEFQDRVNRQSPYVRQRYTSLEQKKEFLDSLVRFEVLAKEAARRGLDRDPEVIRTMKQVMIQKLMREELDAKLTPDSVPEAEIRKYYDDHPADYAKLEQVRASAIVLKNRAQAERVAVEARGEAGQTNKGFRDLVMRYSSDEDGKLRGGDLRYFEAAAKDPPPAVVRAAFALVNIGDVSGAIDAGNGSFYVLKLTGRQHAYTRPYEDAKPQIRNKLFRDRRLSAQKAFIDAARARAKIEVHEAGLAKVRVDMSNAPGDEGKDLVVPPPPPELAGSGAAPAPAPVPPPASAPAGSAPGNP